MQTPDSHIEPHEPHWISQSAFQIVLVLFLGSQIALALALKHNASLWLIIPLVLIISHLMHGAAVGFHEAAHGLLRKNRKLNEIDGVIMGLTSFMSFSLYRAAHQSHHAYLATERDEELWPFVVPGTPRWARVLAAFLELTLGVFFTPFLFMRTFLREGSPIRSRKVRKRIWKELALMVVFWVVIVTAVSLLGLWRYFIWMHLVPLFIAGNLQTWRKYIEHVGMTGSTVKSSTRSIVAKGWMGRLVSFTLLHEPFHGVHHLNVGLPHAELPRRAAELTPQAADDLPVFPSYRHAFVHLLCNLADPRVGAQWRKSSLQ